MEAVVGEAMVAAVDGVAGTGVDGEAVVGVAAAGAGVALELASVSPVSVSVWGLVVVVGLQRLLLSSLLPLWRGESRLPSSTLQ